MKAAIIILSDPKAGEEAMGRVFNGLAAAYDFKQRGTDVGIYFLGTGTRWPALLTDSAHPVHSLFKEVEDRVVGISSGCADVFGAKEDATKAGFGFVNGNAVPGTSGLPSIADIASQGRAVFSF